MNITIQNALALLLITGNLWSMQQSTPFAYTPQLPALNQEESARVRRQVSGIGQKPSLIKESITATMVQEELAINNTRSIITQYEKNPEQQTCLLPYLSLVTQKTPKEAQAILTQQSLPQLYALAEHANYLDIPALLQPTLKAIATCLRSQENRQDILNGNKPIPLTLNLIQSIAPQLLSTTAKIQWLLRERIRTYDEFLRLTRTYIKALHPIRSLAFNPQGTLLASTNDNSQIKLYRFDNFIAEPTILDGLLTTAMAFHPHDNHLAAGADWTISLWDLERCTAIRRWNNDRPNNGPNIVTRLSFNPNNATLASIDSDSYLKLWDPRTSACIRSQEEKRELDTLTDMALHPNGTSIATTGWAGITHVWDPTITHRIQTLPTSGLHAPHYLKFQGASLACINRTCGKFWNPDTGTLINELMAPTRMMMDPKTFACSPSDVPLAAVGTYDSPKSNGRASINSAHKINFLNTEQGTSIDRLNRTFSDVYSLLFHPNGTHLAGIVNEKQIRVWHLFNKNIQKYLDEIRSPKEALFLEDAYRNHESTIDQSLFQQIPQTLQETIHKYTDITVTKKNKRQKIT